MYPLGKQKLKKIDFADTKIKVYLLASLKKQGFHKILLRAVILLDRREDILITFSPLFMDQMITLSHCIVKNFESWNYQNSRRFDRQSASKLLFKGTGTKLLVAFGTKTISNILCLRMCNH